MRAAVRALLSSLLLVTAAAAASSSSLAGGKRVGAGSLGGVPSSTTLNRRRVRSSSSSSSSSSLVGRHSPTGVDVVDTEILEPSSGLASAVIARGGDGDAEEDNSLARKTKVGGYFALWYILNIVYNILNKKMLNLVPAPLTVGCLQFLVGGLYAAFLWKTGIRKTPALTPRGRVQCAKVGFYHMAGQELSMVSLGAGPVSFTHIVKALEPFFSAVVSGVVYGKWMNPAVYATLIPVVAGVGYACLKERSFSWLAFYTAMASNLAFALRAVVSKSALSQPLGENLSSVNLFGVVTIQAFVQSIPLFLLAEGFSFLHLWSAAAAKIDGPGFNGLVKGLVVSGLFHYLNNEVMYLALDSVHPVTLAVGNTMKRVFIVVVSVLVFQNPVTLQAAIGSSVGIAGVLLYSLTKQHYEEIEKKEEEAAAVVAKKGKRGRK